MSNFGSTTSLPFLSMYPTLPPDVLTHASPSEKSPAAANCGAITTLPPPSTKPHFKTFDAFFTATRPSPSEKPSASSNRAPTTALPVASMKPHLPPARKGARPSLKSSPMTSNFGATTSLPVLSMRPYLFRPADSPVQNTATPPLNGCTPANRGRMASAPVLSTYPQRD